jgi:hypothetical protein
MPALGDIEETDSKFVEKAGMNTDHYRKHVWRILLGSGILPSVSGRHWNSTALLSKRCAGGVAAVVGDRQKEEENGASCNLGTSSGKETHGFRSEDQELEGSCFGTSA